jgi:multimeric flavodoxin WrbA
MIKERNTTVLSTDYQPTESLKRFIERCTGAKMTPVKGKEDSYWISGDSRGKYYEQKYYKIVFGPVTQVSYSNGRTEKSGYGFDIQTTGDLNGWQLMGEYRKMIKEAMANYKKESA